MKKRILGSFFIFIIIVALIINPETYIKVSLHAISVWAKILLPCLFPFFVFTKLLSSMGYIEKISSSFKYCSKSLYNTSSISNYVFFMSILTGYPVGSKILGDLYSSNQISKTEAKTVITFTSNSGPMFIVGSVGVGLLISQTAGYIMLASHIVGAILNGLFYRAKKEQEIKNQEIFSLQKQSSQLSSAVADSITSILTIGGIIVVCFIALEVISRIGVFAPLANLLQKIGVPKSISYSVINGFFEITRGCIELSQTALSICAKTIISCAIISFGGISTMLQAMAFLGNICSYKFFMLQKFTHCILSTIVCTILCLIFM